LLPIPESLQTEGFTSPRILREPPLYYRAYCAIKQEIARGNLKPGQRLTDKDLAEYLGISRTPVREAVKLLIKEGLLVSEPNKGVWVFAPSARDLAQIYVLRAELEGLAAALMACNNDRLAIVDRMERIVSEAASAARETAIEKLVELNSEFHDCIVTGSANEQLRELLEPLRLRAVAYRYVSYRDPLRVEVSITEHREIVGLLRGGDPRHCQEAVRRHIYAAGWRLLAALGGNEEISGDPAVKLCTTRGQGSRP